MEIVRGYIGICFGQWTDTSYLVSDPTETYLLCSIFLLFSFNILYFDIYNLFCLLSVEFDFY